MSCVAPNMLRHDSLLHGCPPGDTKVRLTGHLRSTESMGPNNQVLGSVSTSQSLRLPNEPSTWCGRVGH